VQLSTCCGLCDDYLARMAEGIQAQLVGCANMCSRWGLARILWFAPQIERRKILAPNWQQEVTDRVDARMAEEGMPEHKT